MTSKNGYVSRDKLFANLVKRRFKDVDIAGFGKARIRSLTAREKTRYDSEAINNKGGINTKALLTANARLIVACVVDHEGNQVFTDADIEALLDRDASVIEEVASECGKHCGVIEESEKN